MALNAACILAPTRGRSRMIPSIKVDYVRIGQNDRQSCSQHLSVLPVVRRPDFTRVPV
jgi:hypothetical protein